MDKLGNKLHSIEEKLGGQEVAPNVQDKLGWHLDYIESLIEGGGGGGSSTYQAFPETWPVDNTHTTKDFCDAVNADETAIKAMAYLGEVTLNDLPAGIVNSEIKVEVMDGEGTSGKVIHLVCTSGNVKPYRWEYTYWDDGVNVSGWNPLGISQDSIAPLYSNASTYSVGDVVTYSGNLYECTTAVASAEEFNPSKWTSTNVTQLVLGMINVGY